MPVHSSSSSPNPLMSLSPRPVTTNWHHLWISSSCRARWHPLLSSTIRRAARASKKWRSMAPPCASNIKQGSSSRSQQSLLKTLHRQRMLNEWRSNDLSLDNCTVFDTTASCKKESRAAIASWECQQSEHLFVRLVAILCCLSFENPRTQKAIY